MGGKTKQSQRTKNNVRPSSSSRSAGLLSNSTAEGGLVTLGTGKVLPALFPTLAAANFDQGLSPEFQMCVKKLNKKDPITKTKALQELCELVTSGNEDDAVAVLPSWAHFYRLLTVDTDRKVREMAQVVHGAVMRRCGRRAAPQLRRLLPAWLQAQHDEHAPAAAHARASLQSTFPDNKLPEVISFCKAEVMAHLLDNLIGNADAVVTKKTEDVEERQQQLCRLAAGSLQGLQFVAQHAPAALGAWLWAELAPLLQAAAFWKFATHESQLVRSAWYNATGSIVERYKNTFGEKYGVKLLRVLLAAAKDSSSLAAAPLWGCLLLLMHHVEGWHAYLDNKELLTKRIFDVLENGGWGDAKHLTNMLLPLLAHLPPDMLTQEFYKAFFEAMFAGLNKKNILNSKSERQSWITSLAECLRYLSVQRDEFVVGAATGVHRAWLEAALAPQHDGLTRTNLIKCSATNMTAILKYWLKQSKEGSSEKYDQLIRNFWQNVGSTVSAQIDKCGTEREDIGRLIDGHVLFLQTLRTSLTQEPRAPPGISFDDGLPSPPAPAPPPLPPAHEHDAAVAERYRHNLSELAHRVCSHYFEFAERKQVPDAVFTPLMTLLNEFDSAELFSAIARQFDAESGYQLYERVLRGWLAGDTMRCRALVDVVLLVTQHLGADEQDAVFDSFQQFPPSVVEWCVRACVQRPSPAARRFCRDALAEGTLRRVCARAALRPDAGARQLLRDCLAPDAQGEFPVGPGAVSAVLQELSAALKTARGAELEGSGAELEQSDAALERGGALAAELVTALQARAGAAPPHYGELLCDLFTLSVDVARSDPQLSPDTWQAVVDAWREGVSGLARSARAVWRARAAGLLRARLHARPDVLNVPQLEHMLSLCPHLFTLDGTTQEDLSEIIVFTKSLFELEAHSSAVQMLAVRHECVTAQLNCLDEHDNEHIRAVVERATDHVADFSRMELLVYIKQLLFRTLYLTTMILHRKQSDDEEEEGQKSCCDWLLNDEYLETEFCKVVHDYMVVISLHEGYAFWPHYDILETSKPKLESLLIDIITSISPGIKSKVLSTLSGRAATNGFHWAYAKAWYEVQARGEKSEHAEKTDVANTEDVVSGTGYFHCLQAEVKFSPDEERTHHTQYQVMVRSLCAALGGAADAQFAADAARCRGSRDLDVAVNAYYRHNDVMLYERDITSAPWRLVVSNVCVVEFVTTAVRRCGWDAPAHHWDFATITLCSLLNSLERSKHSWGCAKVAMLSRAVLRLLGAVRGFVSELPAACLRREPAPHVAALAAEWADIFAPDLHHNLFSIITHVLESGASVPLTAGHARTVAALLEAVRHARWERLGAASAVRFAPHVLSAHAAAALAARPHHALQYLAYALLQLVREPLVLHDASQLTAWAEGAGAEGAGEDEVRAPPPLALDRLHAAFAGLRDALDAPLADVELGEASLQPAPGSAAFGAALGWLLLADAAAGVARAARGDLVHHYIRIYRERKYAEQLLPGALRLLPRAALLVARDARDAPPPPHLERLFLEVEELSVDEPARASTVGALACRAVYGAVCAGAGARGWWGAAGVRHARALERLVRAYVAPHAVRQQLRELQRGAAQLQDAEVRIAWSSSEVTCVYHVEERDVELRISLSRSHPLTPPRLTAPDAAGPGGNTQWLSLYLAYQNGTLLSALRMWTRAVSARVESSPQCYICYCRLHPASGRLPRVPCHQCNNRFHNSCLRKWFTTSNKSNCPLCRATF